MAHLYQQKPYRAETSVAGIAGAQDMLPVLVIVGIRWLVAAPEHLRFVCGHKEAL